MEYILTILIFLPLPGILLIQVLPQNYSKWFRLIGVVSLILQLVCLLVIQIQFDYSVGAPQFQQKAIWIPLYNIYYQVSLDGISIPFLWVLFLNFLLLSWLGKRVYTTRERRHYSLVLILDLVITAFILSFDLFLFMFTFLLLMVSLFFYLRTWEDEPHYHYGLLYFLIFTGILLLPVMVGFYFASGKNSFDLAVLRNYTEYNPFFQKLTMGGIFLLSALLIGIFPLHSLKVKLGANRHLLHYLPATTVTSLVGFFIFMRVGLPLLPEGYIFWQDWITVLGFVTLFWFSLRAFLEEKPQKMIKWLHLGMNGLPFLGLGALLAAGYDSGGNLTSAVSGITGSLMVIVALNLLYPFFAIIIQPESELLKYSFKKMERIFLVTLMFLLILGIPGSLFFAGYFFIFTSTLQLSSLQWQAVFYLLGVLVYSSALIRAYKMVLAFPPQSDTNNDKGGKTDLILILLVVILILIIGVYPDLFIMTVKATLEDYISRFVLMGGIALQI